MASIEFTFNSALGEALEAASARWRREDVQVLVEETQVLFQDAAKQPDLLILDPQSPPLVIETSYDGADADQDAQARLGKVPLGRTEPIRFAVAVEVQDRFRDLMKNKPSEYWQAHCKATFQYDVIGPMLVNTNNLLTEDTLMWGSDYPHTDGIWPESTKYITEQFAGLTDAQIKKITCDNAVEFYGLN